MDSEKVIYTITMLKKLKFDFGSTRCVGFYYDKNNAETAIKEIGVIFRKAYIIMQLLNKHLREFMELQLLDMIDGFISIMKLQQSMNQFQNLIA